MQININTDGIKADTATTNPLVALITSVTATISETKAYNLSITIQLFLLSLDIPAFSGL